MEGQETEVEDVKPEESSTTEPTDVTSDAQSDEKPEEAKADDTEKAEHPAKARIRKREARLRTENRELREQLQQREAVEAQPELEAPKRDDFSDYEQYLDARAEYTADKRFADLTAKADAKQAERDRKAQIRDTESRWEDSQDAAREKHEDFDEVAFGEVNVTDTMGLAVKDSKSGGEIAYYLGKHPEESDRIAKLQPLAQIKAIGAIEERLKAPASRPAPPKPIPKSRTSQATASNALNDGMSTKDWVKQRSKEVHG